ncbi:MAG: glycosyl transferase [Elusimicrobia bacterium GWA2_69_24]|nr:MAG: glycosyl transferase [Elusimicrobia bacterium GWA2_69_24]HBL17912.1 glycosyl transferase [Elusimicrobiota bacterium]
MRKLSVIVPAFNEERTIAAMLRVLLQVRSPIPLEVLVVDDGSTDGTCRVVEGISDPRLRLIRQPANRGKGAAIRAGIAVATGDWILIQDADLEYDPHDIPALLGPALKGGADAVFGSRILRPNNPASYLRFYWGGRLLTLWTNLLFGAAITDEPTCYKLLRSDLLRSLDLRCEGFEFCPEVTGKLLRRGVPIAEVPISYRPRSIEEGKKIRWIDGIEALWVLLRVRFWG